MADLTLLPCPMCGSDDVQFSSPGGDDDEHSFDFVICNGCGISAGRADCEGNLHDVWNSRAAPSSPVADDGLPPLAEPISLGWNTATAGVIGYTADQVRQVQREAYEAGIKAGREPR